MRAARLLRILLMLQNRGRLTTLEMANELEVARRTVIRDIDALTEAGLPIVVHRGNTGGVELGFNYRSRLVALDAEEAEALGVCLALPKHLLTQLGMEDAAHRACAKVVESLPDAVRGRIQRAQRRLRFPVEHEGLPDERVKAMRHAISAAAIVRLRAKSKLPRTIHPIALEFSKEGWAVVDARDAAAPIPICEWGDVNISAKTFVAIEER